jgi:hypothetical protein
LSRFAICAIFSATHRIGVADMGRSSGSMPVLPRPFWPGGQARSHAVQRAGTEAVFASHTRVLRVAPPPYAMAEELVAQPGGRYEVRSAERHTFWSPTGTFNFVRIQGDTPRSRPLLVSTKLAHAQMNRGRPVVYAGTARFESGQMAWWSNYSGTYQPIAAFRAQAGLPEDKFVPWQKLQMRGTAMQRGVFSERRAAGPPALPGASAGGKAGGPSAGSGVPRRQSKTVATKGRDGDMVGGVG